MSYLRLATRLYNAPLLITPQKLEVIERVFRMYSDGDKGVLVEAVEPRPELAANLARRTQAGYYRTDDGMALVQVLGSLVQRSSGMDAMSGLTSYQLLDAMLSAAAEDPEVKGILMEVDSHGGEGAGLFELAAKIRAIDAVKPVTAHANEQAFSAAYALASSAGELVVAPNGMVGSVGVVMYHVDQSQLDAKRGLTYTPIFAGARKVDFSPHAPLSEEAHRGAREMVDRLYNTFVGHVASMRSVGEDVVRGTEAGLLHPDQAISLGMADKTGNLGAALDSLRGRVSKPAAPKKDKASSPRSAVANAPTQKGNTMEPSDKTTATPTPAATTQQPDPAAQIRADRQRTQAILGHAEAAGRRKLAEHLAFATDMSVEAAAGMMAAAPKEAAESPLTRAMGGIQNPKVGADGEPTAASDKKVVSIDANAVYNRRRADVEKARRKHGS